MASIRLLNCSLFLFGALSTVFCLAAAQQGNDPRVFETRRVTPEPPVLDGRLDDPCWRNAPWQGLFFQREPIGGAPATERTEFSVLYDETNLYVAIRAHDSHPELISRLAGRRDEFAGDIAGITFDTHHDRRTATEFDVTAAGVQLDYVTMDDGINWDGQWDAVWTAKVAMEDSAWTIEMCIPFSQLRFSDAEEQIWGLHVWRWIKRKNEESDWEITPKDAPGMVRLFGEFRGLKGIRGSAGAELVPYVLGKTTTSRKEEGNPFATGQRNEGAIGLDGRIPLTSDAMLNLAINPDFGQVEADPSVVNLTAYETYFTEKRPFFLEGKASFDYSFDDDLLFYTRRIGHAPQITPSVADDAHVRIPQSTSILGAAKVSGKSISGFSIGVLESVTGEENAEIEAGGIRTRQTVEPLTNYAVGRIQQDFNAGDTFFGAMVTATNRDIHEAAAAVLPRSAYAGGLDITHRWDERNYYIKAKSLFSTLRGDAAAITGAQHSVVHYYQRPDASYLSVDSSARSLSGYGGSVEVGRSGGRFRFLSHLSTRSPGLDLNDVGYLKQADIIRTRNQIGYVVLQQYGCLLNYSGYLKQYAEWNYGGESTSDGLTAEANGQFTNFWYFDLTTTRSFPTLDTRVLCGGPALRADGAWTWTAYGKTDPSTPVGAELTLVSTRYEHRVARDDERTVGVWWSPSALFGLTFSTWLNDYANAQQYIETATAIGQPRYVLGRLCQHTFGVTMRINLSLTPELTVQYYGSPFISTGSYSAFRTVASARDASIDIRAPRISESAITSSGSVYSVDEDGDGVADFSFTKPDFNYRQFRSNLVVRWEYLPGSTLFLVWSQDRTGSMGDGNFVFGRDMRGMFDMYPTDVFLAKVSYWFSI